MSQNEPRDQKPGKAQTMAEALHDVGVNTVVSASGNGVLIRVHDRFTPRLLELLRAADGTEPVAPGDEAVKTEAPPEPDDPRRWTKWERPWNRRGCSTGYEPMTAPPAPGTVVALRQTSKPYLPTFAPWWYPLTVATFDGETATFVEAPKLKATLTEYPLSTHWAVLAGSGGQTGTPGADGGAADGSEQST